MKVKAVHWTSRMSNDGTAQVMIYVYANGKKRYYGTGIKIKPENWSPSKEKVIGIPAYVKNSYNAAIESQKALYLGLPQNVEPIFNFRPAGGLDQKLDLK